MERNIFLIFLFLITIILRLVFKTNKIEKAEASISEKKNLINTFFDRERDQVKYTCLPTVENNKDICKVNPNRRCKREKRVCFIDKDDIVEAEKYAYIRLCQKKGHCAGLYEDGSVSCEFTKETCLANSLKSKDISDEYKESLLETPSGELPYTDKEKEQIKKMQIYDKFYWKEGVGCINGSLTGIAAFENYCKTKHACNMGAFNWDSNNYKCTITGRYCDLLGMDLKNGRCTQNLGSSISEGIFGKTLMRGDCPPYKDVWGKKSPDEHEGIMERECTIHLKPPDKNI